MIGGMSHPLPVEPPATAAELEQADAVTAPDDARQFVKTAVYRRLNYRRADLIELATTDRPLTTAEWAEFDRLQVAVLRITRLAHPRPPTPEGA